MYMKKGTRLLACALSAAMIITSAPSGVVMRASASEDMPQLEEDGDTPSEAVSSVFSWKNTEEGSYNYGYADEDSVKISEDGQTLSAEESFSGISTDMRYLSAPDAANIRVDSEALDKVIRDNTEDDVDNNMGDNAEDAEIEDSSVEYSIGSLTYEWFLDGEKLDCESGYFDPDDLDMESDQISNAKDVTKVSCTVHINTVERQGDAQQNLDTNSITLSDYHLEYALHFDYCYCYVGPSKESIAEGSDELKNYFSFDYEDALREETISYSYFAGGYFDEDDDYQSEELRQMKIRGVNIRNSDTAVEYVWKAYSVDGDELQVSEGSNGYWDDEITYWPERTERFGKEWKRVDHYVCEMAVKYGDRTLADYTKTFQLKYSPLNITVSEGASEEDGTRNPVAVRNDGKQTFYARTKIIDTEVVKGVVYQWYSIDEDGRETKLDGETTNTLKQKITDNSISYKCVIRARMQDDYSGKVQYSTEQVFTTTGGSGYYLKDVIFDSETRIGKTVTLEIDARVDSAYSLQYKWQKLAMTADETGYESLTASETLSSKPVLSVRPETVDDFELYSGWVYDKDGETITRISNKNYILTVEVLDEHKEKVETYYYDCAVTEDLDIEVENNQGVHSIIRGEDIGLYAKPDSVDGFEIKQNWYKLIAKAEYDSVEWTVGEDGEPEVKYIYTDEDFEEPKADYTKEITDWWTSTKYRYFYQEMESREQGTVCELLGSRSNGKINDDILGEYLSRIEIYRSAADSKDDVCVRDFSYNYTVRYESELHAYAKNPTVKASTGGTAELEVVACNVDSSVYPITYTWKKKNVETDDYEVMKKEKQSVLSLRNLAEEDFTDYQVVIDDVAHGDALQNEEPVTVSFTLVKQPVKVVQYTPAKSYYKQSMGDQVTLQADLGLTEGTSVFYEWYRREKMMTDTGADDSKEWELLNQDTNEYTFKVVNEDDYTTYKCVASFKTVDAQGDSVMQVYTYEYIVEPNFSFQLERLTPASQKKKPGDSAVYSGRLITDYPDVKEDQAVYQWYHYDADTDEWTAIEGAVESSYKIASLSADDYGRLRLEATYLDEHAGLDLNASLEFYTTLYSEAYLATEFETVETELGKDVLLQPEVVDGGNMELTYQWYRYNGENGRYEIIHGATGESYVINHIGENELTKYRCIIQNSNADLFTYEARVVLNQDLSRLRIDVADGYQQNVKALLKDKAEFAVSVISNKFDTSELKYQWYYAARYGDYKAIGGAVKDRYTVNPVTLDSYGSYQCTVTDPKGRTASLVFTLSQTTGLQVGNDDTYDYDISGDLSNVIGYQTAFGDNVKLTASASASENYTVYYQWYHEGKMLYGEQGASLELSKISEEDLGRYSCVISAGGSTETKVLHYLVYVDTGLVVTPGVRDLLMQADGSVKMFVKAQSDAGETIHYEWSKWETAQEKDLEWNDDTGLGGSVEEDSDEDENQNGWKVISSATEDTYILPEIKKENYGTYRCEVSTTGESFAYTFVLAPTYAVDQDRIYAEQGDHVSMEAVITNPAVDSRYSYTWYVQDTATDTYHKVGNTNKEYDAEVTEITQADWSDGYAGVSYRCVIRDDAEEEAETLATSSASVRVLPTVKYRTTMPETNHPNDEKWNVQGYRIEGATKIKITFDDKTDLGKAVLQIIDQAGQSKRYYKSQMDLYNAYYGHYDEPIDEDMVAVGDSLIVEGDRAIFLMNGNTSADSYGYKVVSVEKIAPEDSVNKSEPTEADENKATETKHSKAKASGVPKKGTKATKGNLIYKITKSAAKNGTVSVNGVISKKKKKVTNITIPATVKIDGYTFKVTAVDKAAMKGCRKLKKVVVGKNITNIGANAFANDKKLKQIIIKGKKLKKVGKKAFAKVSKKAVAKVPKNKKNMYKKLLKKGKFIGKVK